MRNLLEWLSRKWTWATDCVFYYFTAVRYCVEGLDWGESRYEAAVAMQAVFGDRYAAWMGAEKERRAEVRQAELALAEEIKAEFIPGLRERLGDPAQVATTRAELAETRRTVRESGVEAVELLDVLDEVERILDQAKAA